MSPNLSQISMDLEVLKNTISAVPQKVDFIVEQFSTFKSELTKELWQTGNLIGKKILSSLESQVSTVLLNLHRTIRDATEALRLLQEVNDTRVKLQTTYGELQTQLSDMKKQLDRLNTTLNTTGLETDADYTLIPSVDTEIQQLNFISEFNGTEQQVTTLFFSIPDVCTNLTTPYIEDMLLDLNESQVIFRNYSKRLPSLNSFSDAVSNLHELFVESKEDINYYDYIRWSVAAFFCILILIITLLMLTGLVIGASVVISPTVYPFHLQDHLRLTAVYLLYVGSGMIFVFSWLFMIMVFINMFFGGNTDALVCRSWTSGEMFEFLDKQDIFSSQNGSGYQTQDSEKNVTIKSFDIYEGCLTGRSMFYSMHMDEFFNMNEFLNVSMYLNGVNNSLNSLSVDLSNITLPLENIRDTVVKFRDFSNLDQIRYSDFRTLLSTPILNIDLDAFAALLANGTISANLTELAQLVQLQDSYRLNMNTSIAALEHISQNYKVDANNTLENISEIMNEFQASLIVQEVTECMMERATNLLTKYFDIVRYVILNKAMECSWLPVSLDNLYVAACDNLIGPWNAFWLCLGWCCAFLVPGVIFSILIARLWQPPTVVNKMDFPHKTEVSIYTRMDDLKGVRKDGNAKNASIYN
ncbi:prominin-2-like [Hoplias malabaricus]|uniref:prominin-2-like n=1 Tax=Hoplias malabaricus TaxID=27720 RepID=UPI003462BF2F